MKYICLIAALTLVELSVDANVSFAEAAANPDNAFNVATQSPWALGISILSLVIAVTNAAHSIYTKHREAQKIARSDFYKFIESLIALKQEREELRTEMGSEWGLHKNSGLRIALNDRRDFLLSAAQELLAKHAIQAPSAATLIIAANLADDGRLAESLPYYRMAVTSAASEYERASLRTPYGRALILSNEHIEGRQEMLTAFAEFDGLKKESGLDPGVIRSRRADVFRRLVWAQLGANFLPHVWEDFRKFQELVEEVQDSERRAALKEAADELLVAIKDRKILERP
jgi:hypothetical protein